MGKAHIFFEWPEITEPKATIISEPVLFFFHNEK